jgi:hypothetical protein
MRAVIYARFSTDLQDERSIADQVALCREYAQRQGHAVTAIYEDASAAECLVQFGQPRSSVRVTEQPTHCLLLTKLATRRWRNVSPPQASPAVVPPLALCAG